jgi:sugar phosphate isomerase/epimerase
MSNRFTTRRDFFKHGAAVAAGLAVSPAAGRLAALEKTAKGGIRAPFELGLASITFQEFNLDAVITMARRVGLVRISLKEFHLPLTSTEAEIAAAVRKVREGGLVPYGCGVIYMTTPAEVERAFAYAKAGGMEVIIGAPNHELLPLAEKKVKETGIKLAIHNHGPGDALFPTPAVAYEQVKGMDPRLGLCLDIGHSERAGVDPSAAAEAFASRILDVHLKDVSAASKDGGFVEIGRGVIDIPKFLRTLVKLNYRGTASFEYEKDAKDPLAGLAESVGYVKGVLATLPGRP